MKMMIALMTVKMIIVLMIAMMIVFKAMCNEEKK
jgi:hypothetical protein